MNIGIVGLGTVGRALKHGFERLGHTVRVHDRKLNTKIWDLLDTEIIYICVPTPPGSLGACHTGIVEGVVEELRDYRGVVAIKSTIEPGTTERLQKQYPEMKLCHVPEFLRASSPETDFVERLRVLVIGCTPTSWFDSVARVINSHGRYPRKVVTATSTEAELIKYMYNAFNALRIVFADEFWQLCRREGADFQKIKDVFVDLEGIPNAYMDIAENFRGKFGGACLPKDLKAILAYARSVGVEMNLLEAVEKANDHNG